MNVAVEEEVERAYGGADRGKRVYGDISGNNRHCRTSIIAAYHQKKLQAPFRFKGHTNTTVFNTWLVPLLVAGQIVILDNGAFHKSLQTRKIIEAAGAHLLFLPSYSPDMNKIEPQWAKLKARIRSKIIARYESIFSPKLTIIESQEQQLLAAYS